MSIEMNVIDMPVEQVTEAIVAAAKRVRKPKAEITIVEQLITNILEGKFAEEAAALLKQIFGDEFCIKRGLMEKPKKTRKPKAPKEPEASVSEATVDTVPKEKKVRKPKAEATEVSSDAVPKEKKARKPKAVSEASKAVISEEATANDCFASEAIADTLPKEKKARKPKAVISEEATASEATASEATASEATVDTVVPKEKKARKPKAVCEASEEATASEATVDTVVPKEKKARKPKAVSEASEAPVNTDEFSENWGKPLEEELVEEELSDIEEEA